MASTAKSNLTDDAIGTVQNLIQLNIDSRDGFRYAADQLKGKGISAELLRFAQERDANATELTSFVDWNGEEAPRTGSYSASLHRSWMALRKMTSFNDLYAVAAEMERGEDTIVQAYRDAMRDLAGTEVGIVIQSQAALVQATHDFVKSLRDTNKS